jgi:hypothetical protein
VLLSLAVLCMPACTEPEQTAELPDVDDGSLDSAAPSFAVDTSIYDTGFNEQMVQQLQLFHEGAWEMSPPSGPYTVLYGELEVMEVIDGKIDPPWCSFTFALTGYISDELCDTCDIAFDVSFYLLDDGEEPDEEEMDAENPERAYELDDCLTPDMPAHEEIRTLGYSAFEEQIYFDYYDSGIWIPWYEASQILDSVSFEWEHTIGFYGFED